MKRILILALVILFSSCAKEEAHFGPGPGGGGMEENDTEEEA